METAKKHNSGVKVSPSKKDGVIMDLKRSFSERELGYPVAFELGVEMKDISLMKKRRGMNKLLDIKLIPSNIVIRHIYSHGLPTFYSDKTGAYILEFGFGNVYMAKFMWAEQLCTMIVANEKVAASFIKVVRNVYTSKARPKIGLFNTYFDNVKRDIVYKKYSYGKRPVIFHEVKNEIFHEVDFYMNNIEMFMRHGLSGVRKLLFAGEPGTGKTSIAFEIANKYKNEMSIITTCDIESVVRHQYLCSKHKIPGMAILEDAESQMSMTNSDLLNFLSGNMENKSEKGFLFIMTTNRIERIDPRILKRPGRIDRVFKIGIITSEIAFNCAQYYFGNKFKIPENYRGFDNMTGAQIKEIVNSSIILAVSNKEEISTKIIDIVIKTLKGLFTETIKYDAESELFEKPKSKKIGFYET